MSQPTGASSSESPETKDFYKILSPPYCQLELKEDPNHSCRDCKKPVGLEILIPARFLGINNLDDSDILCKTFPKYSKLPGELRAKIVAASLNIPRLMCSHVQLARHEIPGSKSAQKPDINSLCLVSKETRAEALRHIKLSRLTATGYMTFPWSYINPSWDVIFCQETKNDDNKWMKIPNGKEAPGLRKLALSLRRLSPWLNWSSDYDYDDAAAVLATQLRALPDLQEILIVRPFPRFMKHFLLAENPCQHHPSHNTHPKPELTTHSSGFFHNKNLEIETWFERSEKFAFWSRTAQSQTVEDQTDEFVKSLLDEDNNMLRLDRNRNYDSPFYDMGNSQLPFYEYERTSEAIEKHFEGLMKQIYGDQKLPKFTVVYNQEKIVDGICKHY